jgi:hypothetical protein
MLGYRKLRYLNVFFSLKCLRGFPKRSDPLFLIFRPGPIHPVQWSGNIIFSLAYSPGSAFGIPMNKGSNGNMQISGCLLHREKFLL